jgi:ankyrin repeat protein
VLLDLARQGKGTFHRDDEGAAATDAEVDSKDEKGDKEGDAKYLNAPDRFGNTPLQLAVEKGREAMIRFLVATGAGTLVIFRPPSLSRVLAHTYVCVASDVNQVHRVTRRTPLHWAVQHNKISTARLLLELGAANDPVRSADLQVRS